MPVAYLPVAVPHVVHAFWHGPDDPWVRVFSGFPPLKRQPADCHNHLAQIAEERGNPVISGANNISHPYQ